jgi:uncharacterized protein (TIGR02001 family)
MTFAKKSRDKKNHARCIDGLVQKATPFVAAIVLGFTASTASAEELTFSYGVDITSNYISKGSTQTEDRAAVQPYLEASYGLFYAGLWASNARFGGANDIEYDVYAGFTPTWGSVDLDVGFARYFYRDDNTNYGEAYIKADMAATDRVTLGLDYYREVYADQNWLYLNAELADLPWGLTLSGGIGTDLGSRDLGSDKHAIDIGFSRDLSDHSSVDLRAYGGNYDDELVVLTVSFFN